MRDVVLTCVAAQVAIDSLGEFGTTPLFDACYFDNPAVVAALLDRGASADVKARAALPHPAPPRPAPRDVLAPWCPGPEAGPPSKNAPELTGRAGGGAAPDPDGSTPLYAAAFQAPPPYC